MIYAFLRRAIVLDYYNLNEQVRAYTLVISQLTVNHQLVIAQAIQIIKQESSVPTVSGSASMITFSYDSIPVRTVLHCVITPEAAFNIKPLLELVPVTTFSIIPLIMDMFFVWDYGKSIEMPSPRIYPSYISK